MILLEPPVKDWWCPACKAEHRDRDPRARVPLHPCPALRGVSVPMTLDRRAGVRVIERGDYVGTDLVHSDADGRPVMAVDILHDHHNDRTIHVPCIQVNATAHPPPAN